MPLLLRPSTLVGPARALPARSRLVRLPPSRRCVRPTQALFNFGSRSSPRTNQRASEIEAEILSLLSGVPSGKLSPKGSDQFTELIQEIVPFNNAANFRKLDGKYQFVYSSREFDKIPARNRTMTIDGSSIIQQNEISALGGLLSSKARRNGDIEYTRNGAKVTWSTGEMGMGLFGKVTKEIDSVTDFTFLYASDSILVYKALSRSGAKGREPVTIVMERMDSDPKLAEDVSSTPRKRTAGRATAAENKYREKVGSKKDRSRSTKEKSDNKRVSRSASEKAKDTAASKRKTEAEALALKKQAEAEKAADLKKKQELEELLAQLASNVKVAQQEARQASEAVRNAAQKNADALKTAQAAQKKIDSAESSVINLMEEMEKLNAAEREANDNLRQAQRVLQQSSL